LRSKQGDSKRTQGRKEKERDRQKETEDIATEEKRKKIDGFTSLFL